jgi:hypothetical protein
MRSMSIRPASSINLLESNGMAGPGSRVLPLSARSGQTEPCNVCRKAVGREGPASTSSALAAVHGVAWGSPLPRHSFKQFPPIAKKWPIADGG